MGCQIGSAPKSRNGQLHFVEVENGGNESSSRGLVDTELPRPWFTIGLVLSRCVVWDPLGGNRWAANAHWTYRRLWCLDNHDDLWELGSAVDRNASIHSIHCDFHKPTFLNSHMNPYEPPQIKEATSRLKSKRKIAIGLVAYSLTITAYSASQLKLVTFTSMGIGTIAALWMLLDPNTRQLGIFPLLAYAFRVILELK